MNLRRSLWLVFALLSALLAGAAETNKMVLRAYPCQPGHMEFLAPEGTKIEGVLADTADKPSDELERVFQPAGISFPAGSYMYYHPAMSRLVMFNTVANHLLLGQILHDLAATPGQIEIDVAIVAFPTGDIEMLARKQARPNATSRQVVDLWAAGKGRLLGAQKVITRSGVNAQVQGLDEFMYPTEFTNAVLSSQASSNVAGQLCGPILPGNFETREVGSILNVTPTMGPDGYHIDVVMAPESSALVAPSNVVATTVNAIPEPPRFRTFRMTSTAVLESGATIAVAGTPSRTGDELVYLLIRADLLDAAGDSRSGPATNTVLRGIELQQDDQEALKAKP